MLAQPSSNGTYILTGLAVETTQNGRHVLEFPKETVEVGDSCAVTPPDGGTFKFTIVEVGELDAPFLPN